MQLAHESVFEVLQIKKQNKTKSLTLSHAAFPKLIDAYEQLGNKCP